MVALTSSVALKRSQIWVVEDDASCLFVYQDILQKDYDVQAFSSLENFQTFLGKNQGSNPDLLIADLNLKDGAFLDLLEQDTLASYDIKAPFIVVSVVDDHDVLEKCSKKGAVDYLTKPFNKNELVFKVNQACKKKLPSTQELGKIRGPLRQELEVDSYRMRVSRHGQQSHRLTLKELQLFSMFLDDEAHRQTRQRLIKSLWMDEVVCPQVLNVHLKNLRAKIEEIGLEIAFSGTYYILRSAHA